MKLTIDRTSLLVNTDAERTLGDLEDRLASERLTLGFPLDAELRALTVAEWFARGTPGAPSSFADPADHVVAGLSGTLGERVLTMRPCPRRAVGPDLMALFHGTGERLGRVTSAWLRVHARDAERATATRSARLDHPLDPPLGDDEARVFEAIVRACLPERAG